VFEVGTMGIDEKAIGNEFGESYYLSNAIHNSDDKKNIDNR
jgi:hypothetical protein